MKPTKKKGPPVPAVGPLKKQQSSLKSSDKSTGTEAQHRRIIAALRLGPKTTDDLRALGVYQVSARIHALRHRRGHDIDKVQFSGQAADGYSHARMARYTLVAEPGAAAIDSDAHRHHEGDPGPRETAAPT
ncbi:hypothetical protein LJR130_001063 [Variovorax sp. LjRoot130]|uniref:helix-turn-helix domain-containing protein n=1 Tax=Variovorax sp. LjRoot130 TaxID=3342261 RepID=UPI003ED06EFC